MQLLRLEHIRSVSNRDFFCIGLLSEVNTVDLKVWSRIATQRADELASKRVLELDDFWLLAGGPRKSAVRIPPDAVSRLQRALLRRLSNLLDFFG